MTALTAREMEVLEFERAHFIHQGNKDDAIRRRWNLPPSRYYQMLNEIITKPEAEMYDPPQVRRLRRLRDARQERRGARTKGWA